MTVDVGAPVLRALLISKHFLQQDFSCHLDSERLYLMKVEQKYVYFLCINILVVKYLIG